jgi:hypothetical protein
MVGAGGDRLDAAAESHRQADAHRRSRAANRPIAGESNSYLAQNVLASSNDRGATWSQTRIAADQSRDGSPNWP